MTPVMIRRRIDWVMRLALERIELDALRDRIYARLGREQATGLCSQESIAALSDYTWRDDRWIARRESLPPELEDAFTAANALVTAAARAVLIGRVSGGCA